MYSQDIVILGMIDLHTIMSITIEQCGQNHKQNNPTYAYITLPIATVKLVIEL